MNLKTKYKPGQLVYTIYNNNVLEGYVYQIHAVAEDMGNIDRTPRIKISYVLAKSRTSYSTIVRKHDKPELFDERDVFKTKTALKRAL
jgi:hypothetical protein